MKFEIILIAGCILIIALCAFALIGTKAYTCTAKAERQGYECEWGLFTGCMVKIDGKWVDYDKWRVTE